MHPSGRLQATAIVEFARRGGGEEGGGERVGVLPLGRSCPFSEHRQIGSDRNGRKNEVEGKPGSEKEDSGKGVGRRGGGRGGRAYRKVREKTQLRVVDQHRGTSRAMRYFCRLQCTYFRGFVVCRTLKWVRCSALSPPPPPSPPPPCHPVCGFIPSRFPASRFAVEQNYIHRGRNGTAGRAGGGKVVRQRNGQSVGRGGEQGSRGRFPSRRVSIVE